MSPATSPKPRSADKSRTAPGKSLLPHREAQRRGVLCDIHQGDALQILRGFRAESVQCCVTSPPYWGLRDYGVPGQMGLESTPEEYVAQMTSVFEEVRRVLKNDGTCWVNMGDSYSSNAGGYSDTGSRGGSSCPRIGKGTMEAVVKNRRRLPISGLKPKDLCGMPWRLAFALRAAGWYLRQDIIWHKPNPMPESVRDRCTKSHEYIFLLSKSETYFYDAFSIREPLAEKTYSTFGTSRRDNGGGILVKSSAFAEDVPIRKPKNWKTPDGWDTSKGTGSHGSIHRAGRERGHTREHQGFNEDWDKRSKYDQQIHGANKRSVWTVATTPYREAHFATFPPDLIKPCILAGSRPGDVILDPFGGSGTTGMVALELGRNAVLIELNSDYVRMARQRIQVTPGLNL